MNLELHCIIQKTPALIRAYIGYYPITPTNKKLLQKMTSVLPVRLGYKQKTPLMWGLMYREVSILTISSF